ncbi:MAG: DUF308 domain-containing protein [Candidatus Thorarchaeota archaeon]
MVSVNYPDNLRFLDVVIGIISLGLGFWIILDASLVSTTIIFLMGLVLAALGFGRIAKGIFWLEMRNEKRAVNILVGIISMGLAVAVFLLAWLALELLVIIVALGILIMGVARIYLGFSENEMQKSGRALNLAVGVVAIIVGVFSMIFPAIGFFTLAFAISLAFVFFGLSRILGGISGKVW